MPPDGSIQQGGKRKQPCYRRRCVTHRAADPLIALLFCFSLQFYCESKSTEIITSRPRTSQDEPETEKKPLRSDKTLTNYEADLLVIMRTNVSVSRKCRACGYIGQTHPDIHILKSALMLTATIKSVLSAQALALWPCCWKRVSNDAVYFRQ